MAESYCWAPLNYPISFEVVEPVEVEIFNGRTAEFSWERHGFELVEHVSNVQDWSQDAQIEAAYYAEMEALAKTLSGCDHALIAGHINRNPEAAEQHVDYAPIQYVHSDFTETYGRLIRSRYRESESNTSQALARAGIDVETVFDAKRILILQFWRNVGSSAMDLPLALCDARTAPASDLTSYHVPQYAGDAVPFDTYAVHAAQPQDRHLWYTFPQMGKDEVIAFRTYDSELAANGGHFWTPHTAFQDPCIMRPDARHSIEVRATCLFG